jgi:hypothetical protein
MATTTTPSAGQSPSSNSPPSSRLPPWTPTSPPSRPSVRLRSPTLHPPCGALTRAAANGPWPRPWRGGDWALTSDGVDRWPSGSPEPDRRGGSPPPSLSSSPTPPPTFPPGSSPIQPPSPPPSSDPTGSTHITASRPLSPPASRGEVGHAPSLPRPRASCRRRAPGPRSKSS